MEQSEVFDLPVLVEVIHDVDRVLEKKEGVVTSDAIILDRCPGWLNLVPSIVENLRDVWVITF